MSDVGEKIKQMLLSGFSVLGEVTDDARLVEDLGMDSIDLAELELDIESEFGLPPITGEESEKLKTVGDLILFVEEAVSLPERTKAALD